MIKRSIIITSQLDTPIRANIDIRSDNYIICADGGFIHAFNEGIVPHAVIGDFDSSSYHRLEDIMKSDPAYSQMEIVRTPPEKDDTDTFMCAAHALKSGTDGVCIIGGLSGRFDHSIANIQTLSYLLDHGVSGWILDGKNKVTILQGPDEITLKPHETAFTENSSAHTLSKYFSIYSYTEKCTGVCETGSKYLLDNATIIQSESLGTSNELLDRPATVKVGEGRLLVVRS